MVLAGIITLTDTDSGAATFVEPFANIPTVVLTAVGTGGDVNAWVESVTRLGFTAKTSAAIVGTFYINYRAVGDE
jgi:hypothetical protein